MADQVGKILIVENQNFQFSIIIHHLRNKNFQYYPDNEKNYVEIIDHVRVWVNNEYGDRYRECSLDFINEIVEKENISLFLMDHILGGAYHCLTGIDLVQIINQKRKENGKSIIPVVFLSKTELNEKNRQNKYKEYEKEFPNNSVWVHKGYFGDEILNETYFNECVIKEINKLFESTANINKPNITEYIHLLKIRKDNLKKFTKNLENEEEFNTLDKMLPILMNEKTIINDNVVKLLRNILSNIESERTNHSNYSEMRNLLKF